MTSSTKNNEMVIDPQTKFSVKFDNGMIFKSLIEFMYDIMGDNIIYFKFDQNLLKFHHRLINSDDFPALDVCCEIRQYCLTNSFFNSLNKEYILGVQMKEFKSVVKCNKGDYLLLERDPNINKGGIMISNNPKNSNFLRQENIFNYSQFIEPKYKTSIKTPNMIVDGQEFTKLCQSFKSDNSKKTIKTRNTTNTININIFPKGLVFVDTKQNDKNEILAAHYRHIGTIDNSVIPISCYTTKKNITSLIKLDKVCGGANIRIYIEKNEDGTIKPIKMIYPIGSMGRITVYMGIKEYEPDTTQNETK